MRVAAVSFWFRCDLAGGEDRRLAGGGDKTVLEEIVLFVEGRRKQFKEEIHPAVPF